MARLTQNFGVYSDDRVCLSVCPRAYLQNYASDLRRNFRARHQRSAARSSSGGVEISYVLPVLLMTSYLHLKVGNRRRISDSTTSCCTDLTPRRVLKLTHEGQHRTRGAESAIYGCGKPVRAVYSSGLARIYKISYDLSSDCRKFIVGSTYDSDLQRAKLCPRNIASLFTNTVSDDLTTLQVKSYPRKALRSREMFCKLDVRRKSIVTLALS